jgi:two-component system response regulator TtrR
VATKLPDMSEDKAIVFVVDDDPSMRRSLESLLRSVGHDVRLFSSAPEFMQAVRNDAPGCLVLDVRLPGMSGPELQEYLRREAIEIPIVFVSGHGDVQTAVNALKGGAVDFIPKPFSYREVLAVIEKAFRRDAELRGKQARRAQVAERLATLTERERGVLQRIIEGKANKVIAAELDISVKTVEAHRSKVMEKMGVDSVAELVQRTLGFSLMESPGGGG